MAALVAGPAQPTRDRDRTAELVRIGREVVVPPCCVLERIGVEHREDPAVAAARLDPRDRALVRLVLVVRHPADEQRREAAVRQMPCRFAYDQR